MTPTHEEHVAIKGMRSSVFSRPDSIRSHHSPHPTPTATFRPRIHARPIRRQAPTGGPLTEALDLVPRSDSHGDDETAAIEVGRLVATQAWKTLWLVPVFGCWEARSATEATVEPPVTLSRNQEAKIPDERRVSIGLKYGAARGTP